MTLFCEETGSPHPRESPKHWIGLTAEDIPPGWMDDMIKRLFEVTNRDLIRLETAQIKQPVNRGADNQPAPEDLKDVMPDVEKRQRLVAKLQGTIERLMDMELKRQPERKGERKTQAATKNGERKNALKQRIVADRHGKASGKSE